MADSPKKSGVDWGSWIFIVIMLNVFWPVGLLLLFSKLFGSDEKKKQPAPPLQTAPPVRTAASDGKAKTAAKKMTRSPAMKSSTARSLKIFGLIAIAAGVVMAADPAGMVFAGYFQFFLWDMLKALSISAAGLGMLWGGVSMERSIKRYARYLAVIGNAEAASFAQLAAKLGFSEKTVVRDLQKMIEKGYFGGRAYLNMELGYFFRSTAADAEVERQRTARETAKQTAAPKEAEEGYSGILRNIRRANDAIADPELSAKIDRLEEITAKIFRAVEEDPQKRSRIDTFLNYYLPTTQKLLDSYAEFESAGVEGDNLRQAKSRIETTMDSIVKGFEHQLDELYKADAMDVDSDIRVMETMLHRDTATVDSDFGLGGAAAQKKPQDQP